MASQALDQARLKDRHRALIQVFNSRKILTLPELQNVFAIIQRIERGEERAVPAEQIPKDWINSNIADINDEIRRFDYEISTYLDQTDRTPYWAIVNLESDSFLQLATSHSADELAFFRRILDAMFDTNNQLKAEVFAVKRNDAEQLHRPPKEQGKDRPQGLTRSEGEAALEAFMAEGWLVRSESQWYSLAPRALMELNAYLRDTYDPTPEDDEGLDPDDSDVDITGHRRKMIKDCKLCSHILTVGQRCDDWKCPIRMHTPCAEKYFAKQMAKKCPGCKKPWTGENPVGEKAAGRLKKRVRLGTAADVTPEGGAANGNGATPAGSTRKRKQRHGTVDEDGDETMEAVEEEEMEGEEEPEAEESGAEKEEEEVERSSKKVKQEKISTRSRRVVEDDDEGEEEEEEEEGEEEEGEEGEEEEEEDEE